MEEKDKDHPEEKFSDDPQENLRIENEILKLKMQAQSGALFGGSSELPPEIENEFLLQVQQFEDAWKDVKYVKVYDLIGKPDFKKAEKLPDSEVKDELEKLLKLLNEHNINLNVSGEYEPRIIYRFITEELFVHETDDMNLPGMSKNFSYEEFHPNHEIDIKRTAQDFLNHWFENSFNEYSTELNNQLVTADGKTVTREEVITKLCNCLDSYASFSNIQFGGSEVHCDWNDEEGKGLGHAEGMFRYDAQMESGETVHIEGPFKLYMSNEDYGWSIFYFVFPGFQW